MLLTRLVVNSLCDTSTYSKLFIISIGHFKLKIQLLIANLKVRCLKIFASLCIALHENSMGINYNCGYDFWLVIYIVMSLTTRLSLSG